ncbi:MAG: hypothetical protein QM749_02820 [Aquabacterium sp.]
MHYKVSKMLRLSSNLFPLAKASLLSLMLAMAGCADWPAAAGVPASRAAGTCESGLSATDNTRLAGVEQLLGDGKPYAALAQLDALKLSSPQVDLLRADALRRIDRDQEAIQAYKRLEGTCIDGRAQHGLGLIAAKAGRKAESLQYFQKARQALPVDTRVRNDLGYGLLLIGQYDAAQFEFLTVLDLNPGDNRASRNLVLLTMLRGQQDKALELARQLGLDATAVSQLKNQAESLRTVSGERPPDQMGSMNTPTPTKPIKP